MEQLYCQSCGMPIMVPEHFGTNKSGNKNEDYCHFCYRNGEFTANISMDEMIELCAEYVDEWNTPDNKKLTREEAIELMRKDFPRLKRWIKRKATENEYHKAVNKAVEYINKHLSETIDLETLANVANLSPFHFHRIFRSIIGENTGEFIQRLRLEHIAMLLQTTEMNLEDIAERTGYQTKQALSKAFKKHFGLPPSTYRNQSEYQSKRFKKTPSHIKASLQPSIKQVESKNYIYIRIIDVYGNPKSYNVAWGKLLSFALKNNLVNEKTEYIGLSFDDPNITSLNRCRFHACMTIDRDVKPEGEIGVQSLDGGLYAIFTMKGAYSGLSDIYNAIYSEWLPNSEYRLRNSSSYEKYLNTPGRVKDEELLTEIYIPIKPH